MVFNIPKFENNKVLSEEQLYALAQLSLEYFRWNCIADKQYGFFAPLGVDTTQSNSSWNQFRFEGDTLSITNLYLISKQGYPFIFKGTEHFTKPGRILYAVAKFAQNSQSHSGTGYEVSFEWDLPEVDSPVTKQEPFFIKLATVIEENGQKAFSLEPPVIRLDSTSDLWDAASKLKDNLDNYINQLVKHNRKNRVDRSELLHRCDALALLSENTRTDTFVKDARLALKSVRGFYHRLIYQEIAPNDSPTDLVGRALEEDLIQTKGNSVQPEIFDPIDDCLSICHIEQRSTGQDRIALVKKLLELFSNDSSLFKRLRVNLNLIPVSNVYLPQEFDGMRELHRYELLEKNMTGQVFVEFTEKPINVGFVFSSEATPPDRLPLLKRNARLEQPNSTRHRYLLLGKLAPYLFIAAPPNTILKVELI